MACEIDDNLGKWNKLTLLFVKNRGRELLVKTNCRLSTKMNLQIIVKIKTFLRKLSRLN